MGWQSRVEDASQGPCLRATGEDVRQLARRLVDGGLPDGLDPSDALAALASLGLGPEGSLGPPLTRAEERPSEVAAGLDEPLIARLFPKAPRAGRLALLAGLLQVHGRWDDSHHAAQKADDLGEAAHSAYWHGIAHRREPDPGNASYWFRRVGQHPLFPRLAREGRELAPSRAPLRGESWDPFAFIELCGRAHAAGGELEAVARRLQRLEMALLLDATLDAIVRA